MRLRTYTIHLSRCSPVPRLYLPLTLPSEAYRPVLPILFFLSPCGDEGIRTPGLRRAKAALSQLSYIPVLPSGCVGLSGLEPETLPLSEARSNQLS